MEGHPTSQTSILWDPVSKAPSLVNSNLDTLAVINCPPMMSSQTFSSHTWNLWNSLLLFPNPIFSSCKFPYNFSTDRPCFRNVRICEMIRKPVEGTVYPPPQFIWPRFLCSWNINTSPPPLNLTYNSHLSAPPRTLLMYSHNPSLKHFPSWTPLPHVSD